MVIKSKDRGGDLKGSATIEMQMHRNDSLQSSLFLYLCVDVMLFTGPIYCFY
jgi:hypothetical protein